MATDSAILKAWVTKLAPSIKQLRHVNDVLLGETAIIVEITVGADQPRYRTIVEEQVMAIFTRSGADAIPLRFKTVERCRSLRPKPLPLNRKPK